MEVPVQLQTAAFVLVDGLDGHVKKVWTFFTYVVDHILSWHCPCLWIILLAVCMCGKFGRERKCSAMYLPCYCLRVFQLYIDSNCTCVLLLVYSHMHSGLPEWRYLFSSR